MLRQKMLTCFALASIFTLSSCYRVPVPQGNVLPEQKVHKIIRGMTTSDIIRILGSPVLHNTFANNQAAYVYTYKTSGSTMTLKRAIFYLQNDRVVKVTFDANTNGQPLPPQNV
ncbi:MAG: hypothetical protein A3F10_01210 [Coxiella sp. RIFCSPHIGHO2_12_FULL_42_15]|nr:MAG: hypothetical protein A3F10_01210 [Coxiella sp. RIFCSPHIGHO2_12_FULL_42_15]